MLKLLINNFLTTYCPVLQKYDCTHGTYVISI